MHLSPSQYRARMYHIDMSTSKSSVEDAPEVSMNADQGQMTSSGFESSSTSRMQILRSLSRTCLYRGDISCDDSWRVPAKTHQGQMRSSGIDTRSMSRMQISRDLYRACLYHGDMFSSDDNQEISANAPQGQSLLQEHGHDIPLTSQEVLCDLLETQRVSLSSYINVVKKRLLSSLGVMKIPVPGRKVRVACHVPSK